MTTMLTGLGARGGSVALNIVVVCHHDGDGDDDDDDL